MIQAAVERKGGRGSGITCLTTTFQKWFDGWLPYHPRDRPRRGSGSIVNAFPNQVAEPRPTGSVALAAIRAFGGGVPWFYGRIKPVRDFIGEVKMRIPAQVSSTEGSV